jgi:diguanylate cyclase (GGDEF)-like protein/PAS domain S-box-containing protein
MAVGAGVLVVDRAGTILLCNPTAERLLDRAAEELIGSDLGFPLVPGGVTEIDIRRPDLSARTVAMHLTETTWDDGPAYLVTLRDVSVRTWEPGGGQSQEQFLDVFEESPIGLAILSPDLRFVRVNDALCDTFGYSREELRAHLLGDITHPADSTDDVDAAEQSVAGRHSGHEFESQFTTKAGDVRCGLFTTTVMHDAANAVAHVIVTVKDITEHKESLARVSHLALHDPLTGLPNRALVMDHLRLAQSRSDRNGSFVGLLLLDLDDFKDVNDTFGHDTGDSLLIDVAGRLTSVLRPSDTAARLGGDEFVVCCEDLGPDEAHAQAAAVAVAERFARSLGEPSQIEGPTARTTASIGITLIRGSEQSPEQALRNADQAMYRAKQQGRARYELYDHELQALAVNRAATRDGLALALSRDELVVHYQPVARLSDGRITSVEALLRWNHPARGLLLPGEFLDVAEESGLIVPIGHWVLGQACQDLALWRAAGRGDLVVMVNIAARQLSRNDLATSIELALSTAGLPASALELELTETTLIQADEGALEELAELLAPGVQLGLDDFGTGYASLTYLRRLPVEFLKIDRSFVAGLGDSPDDAAIVNAIINLAHALGVRVVGEGVESPAQREVLETMGCDYAQGWLFSRPMPAAAMTAMFAAPGR